MNAHGDAAVAYVVSPYGSNGANTFAEYTFRSGPNGTWTTPIVVSEAIPSSTGYVAKPQVALDANGLATVTYVGYGVEANRQLAGGTWTGHLVVILPPNQFSGLLSSDLALDNNGNAIVAVSIFDSTINVDRASVWVARGAPTGSWTAAQRLTDPTAPVDAYAARCTISLDGTLAMVGWIDHYHGTVQVSQLTGTSWGAAKMIGHGTAWASFQEVLGLKAGSGSVARAIWKNAKNGAQIMAANYGR